MKREGHLMIRGLVPLIAFGCWGMIAGANEVNLRIAEPSGVTRRNCPVTSGIPIAMGQLNDASAAALFSNDGHEIPLQTETLSKWPDGSIRWLLLDFLIDLGPREEKTLTLRYGSGVQRTAIQSPVTVVRDERNVTIRTGPLSLQFTPDNFRWLGNVSLDRNDDGQFSDDERVTTDKGSGIVLTAPDGTRFAAELAKADIVVEQSGPIRACVRISGTHASDQRTMFHYVLRLHAYRGQPSVRTLYTFVNDHTQDLMSRIKSIDATLVLRNTGSDKYLLDGKSAQTGRLFQVDDRGYEIDGKPSGEHALGWAAQGNEAAGVAVGVRNFWQMWPKAIDQSPGEIRIGICPSFPTGQYDGKSIVEESQLYYYLRDGTYTFKVGAARTHELWTFFFKGAPNAAELNDFFHAAELPLLAQCSPAYISETKAAGAFPPADPNRYLAYDAWMHEFFEMHLADRERVRETGLLNFGDWYNTAWQEWGNLEYDTSRIWFQQYLRTGDRRYFDRAEQAARYHVDVDVCHAVNPEVQAYGGSANMRPGQIWAHSVGHTGGYYGKYVNGEYQNLAPLKMTGAHQLGFYDFGHTWIGGAFDHYMLTGDGRAKEIGIFASNTMADLCPTRYSDHIRNIGWPFHLVLNAYDATGDKKFLDAAGRQWQILKQNFDPEKGWIVMLAYGHCSEAGEATRCRGNNMYMLGFTLTALARYHRMTNDPEVLKALSTGIDQMIREAWSEKHKSFYLTSCRHAKSNPPPAYCSATFHASEAFVYESNLTGNKEHLRVIREALQTAIAAGVAYMSQKDLLGQTGYYSGSFLFAPFALSALSDDNASDAGETHNK